MNPRVILSLAITVLSLQKGAAADPEKQQERDWIDSRWNQTDVGQFLASTLQLPSGYVPKGLSVRVGDYDEAAVCYDTATGTLRAGWTSGFLSFDPARFGIIRWPKVDGQIKFFGPATPSKPGDIPRYEGFRLNGKRLVLSWQFHGAEMRESPWFTMIDGMEFFTRDLELAVGGEVRLDLLEDQRASPLPQRGTMAGLANGLHAATVLCLGTTNAAFETREHSVSIAFPARTQLTRCKLLVWAGATRDLSRLATVAEKLDSVEDLQKLPPNVTRWLPELITRGQPGLTNDILGIDNLTLPNDNPWKALMFLSGVGFRPDGTAFVSAIHGDVWRVQGIDDSLRALRWKRFATGLFQPLGLNISKDRIFVLGRDQITELIDENNDGEADVYRNFSNLIETSTSNHDFVTCLESDSAGNFYYVDPRGIHRIAADGRKKETLASGWRNPNGLGVSPSGLITVAPQQGEWTPSSAIVEVKPGGFYGYGGPRVTSDRPIGYDLPLCWIPHSIDNSSGSQVWVPPGHWDALGGQMLHLVWGRCSLMFVLRDEVNGIPQGAAVPLPGRFVSGPMRGTFAPHDGHFYVACCNGWQTSAVKDGSLQRVRYTGKPMRLPVAWKAHSNGISITFSTPLAPSAAEDPGSYSLAQWNYRYSKTYGSDDWSVKDAAMKGHDTLEIEAAKLSPDHRSVFLQVAELRPVMQLEIKYNLEAADGARLRNALYATINKPAPAKTD